MENRSPSRIMRALGLHSTLKDRLEHLEARALPLGARLLHKKTRRHILAIMIGTSLMLTGSTIALNAHVVCEKLHLPHTIVDACAYTIHAIGTLPIVGHFDKLLRIFLGD